MKKKYGIQPHKETKQSIYSWVAGENPLLTLKDSLVKTEFGKQFISESKQSKYSRGLFLHIDYFEQ